MAWIEKRPGRKNLYVCFRDANSRRIAKSTGTNNQELAQQVADEITAIHQGRSNEMRLKKLFEGVEGVIGKNDFKYHCAIESTWAVFHNQPQPRSIGKNTLEAKKRHIQNWIDWMRKNHPEIINLDELTERHAGEYAASLSNRSGSTRNNHLSNLKSVFSIIRIAAGLNRNIWEAIPRVENRSISKEALTLKQVNDIYNASMEYHSRWPDFWPTAIMLGFHTGLRLGYVCTLSWDEISLKENLIRIKKLENSDRKSRKELQFPIPDELLSRFKALHTDKSEGYIWPNVAKAKLSRQGALYKEFREICESCHIETSREPDIGENRKEDIVVVGFHSLRHTYITLAKDAGADISDIQKAVGHGSPKMTNQYNQSLEYAKRIAEKFPTLIGSGKHKK